MKLDYEIIRRRLKVREPRLELQTTTKHRCLRKIEELQVVREPRLELQAAAGRSTIRVEYTIIYIQPRMAVKSGRPGDNQGRVGVGRGRDERRPALVRDEEVRLCDVI